MPGGRTRIAVHSPCRAEELVTFTYAGAVFMQWLDPQGRADFVLDCFAGDGERVAVRFEDKTTVVRRPVVGDDLRDYSKVAIVWSSSVDLDLHAFEYSAVAGAPGHVWSGRPGSIEEAKGRPDGRGGGYLSSIGTGGEVGMNVEVYTFVHRRGQPAGSVELAVDYKTRGSRPEGRYCGSGHLAALAFEAYILERNDRLRKLELAIPAAPCGAEIDAGTRFNAKLIPDLVIR